MHTHVCIYMKTFFLFFFVLFSGLTRLLSSSLCCSFTATGSSAVCPAERLRRQRRR